MKSAEWQREHFATTTGIETARTLAAINHALHAAWPYMDTDRWSLAVRCVQAELVEIGLPPDLRPYAVDDVLARITAAPAMAGPHDNEIDAHILLSKLHQHAPCTVQA